MATETPRLKRARYVMRTGDHADVDRLRERYAAEASTPGITSRQKRDLEHSLAEIDKHLWGDRPALRAVPKDEQPPSRNWRQRASAATAIHARRGDEYLGRGARRARRAGARRYQQTGIPQTAESITQLTMRTLGGIAALSFLYLLTTPRGSRAVQLTGSGVTHALQALVNPNVDPLRATAAAKAAQSAQAQAALQARGRANVAGLTNNVANAVNNVANAVGTGASKPTPAPHLSGKTIQLIHRP